MGFCTADQVRGFLDEIAFEADVLAENKAMPAAFARSGLPMRQRREGGIAHVTLSLRQQPP